MSLDWIWFSVVLKLPLILLALAVWWAIRHEPEDPAAPDEDGGVRRSGGRHHPLRPFPRHPRRGPHGGAPPPAPKRVRVVRARARSLRH